MAFAIMVGSVLLALFLLGAEWLWVRSRTKSRPDIRNAAIYQAEGTSQKRVCPTCGR